jgi:hypothetical protein
MRCSPYLHGQREVVGSDLLARQARAVLEALAGGAIGSILVGLAWAGARLYALPGDVRAHDREAAFVNESLEIWVADDYRKLRQELDRITNDLAARGLLNSGIHGAQRSEAKTRCLHRCRDHLHQAKRRIEDLQRHEGWLHAAWRRLRRLPELALTAPERVAPVLDDIRKRTTRHGGEPAQVHDPTRFKLDDLLRQIKERPLE